MSEPGDKRGDVTRQRLLRAAAHQFAEKSYSLVNLDDIIAEAHATKGAMYFHFQSKKALAMTLIHAQNSLGMAAVDEVLAKQLSGLETVIDITILIAVRDIGDDLTRAGLNLLQTLGPSDDLGPHLLSQWITAFSPVVERAVDDGDIRSQLDPEHISRLAISLYMGIRQTRRADEREQLLSDLERAWLLMLPTFANPDRITYLTEFIRRRISHARHSSQLSPNDEPDNAGNDPPLDLRC